MTLLAIDPGRSYKGGKTIGYCLFTEQGEEIKRGSLSFEDLVYTLNFDSAGLTGWGYAIYTVVIEDFVNDPKSARGGQRNGTSECIGAVEAICIKAGRTLFVRQRSATLGTAKLLADYQGKAKHLPHQDSAYLHGYYYLVQKGVLSSKGLQGTM